MALASQIILHICAGQMRCVSRVYTGIDLADHRPAENAKLLRGRPLLLIHGTADTIISCSESRRLHQCTAHLGLWLIDGFGHIQAAIHPEYAKRLRPILRRIRIGICA